MTVFTQLAVVEAQSSGADAAVQSRNFYKLEEGHVLGYPLRCFDGELKLRITWSRVSSK